jgi:hypothetical protein
MTAFAALTFVGFSVSFFAFAWLLAALNSAHPVAAYFLAPYAGSGWTAWLWAIPLRFGRKLWFALLMSAWNFADPSGASALAVLVFASLLAMLGLGLWLRPYAHAGDNQLETACIVLLLYGYFISVLPGSPAAAHTSVTLFEAALVAYWAWRWLGPVLCERKAAASLSAPNGGELALPLMSAEREDASCARLAKDVEADRATA